MSAPAVEAMRPGWLTFVSITDDEVSLSYGWFTGEVEWTGAHVFQESPELDRGEKLYVFPEEIHEFDTHGR